MAGARAGDCAAIGPDGGRLRHGSILVPVSRPHHCSRSELKISDTTFEIDAGDRFLPAENTPPWFRLAESDVAALIEEYRQENPTHYVIVTTAAQGMSQRRLSAEFPTVPEYGPFWGSRRAEPF